MIKKSPQSIVSTHTSTRGTKVLDVRAENLGQDERSCVVYGMPKEAHKLGATPKEVPLSKIPLEIMNYWNKK